MTDVATIGVEEEFFLVDREGAPQPAAAAVIARAATELGDQISGEFTRYQVEIKTRACEDAKQLRAELAGARAAAVHAAAAEGLRLCASGTPVLDHRASTAVGDHPRYRAGVAQYRTMLDDFMVCSLHVHVHVVDREHAVLIGNHLRPWLPLLLAVSANSPFHRGVDTGYVDWRAIIRSRFPCLGPPPYAESLRHHEDLAAAMADSGAMLDAATPFWDIRPNPHVPTLELRSMDVTADIDDTVALAVLTRSLVATASASVRAGDRGPRTGSELLRAAYWRAARDGWSGCGVDALSGQVLPAPVQMERLLDHVGDALHYAGDHQVVREFVARLAAQGTGAERQRASLAESGTFAGVVDDVVTLTART
ncbi:carboxylate--amine ligase [Mycobacterium sp. ACS1612]|uniref:carboxylate-amine ligase n=1 Tax=Mycobacterium sp. ACS1612 TaxID=1834117 RepID=UPI0008005EDE|nr:glutamate--cysteine ligase [Mycobacterium sp. ACS1612]OBF33595.1 carboxylate--amine ligase [Mycobacterium sp. ACS1612]